MAQDKKPDVYWEGEFYAPSELKRMEIRVCNRCNSPKPFIAFPKSSNVCHLCSGLKKNWVYESLVSEFGELCMICGAEPSNNRRLFIDHNHSTNEIRGLLCSNCNTGLGMFYDNPAILMSAISYLRRGGS